MKYVVLICGRSVLVEVDGGRVGVNGQVRDAHLATVDATPVRLLALDGDSHEVIAVQGEERGRWRVTVGADRFDVEVTGERELALRALLGTPRPDVGGGSLRAPMPGLVVRVEIEQGQRVAEGTGLVVVEAMKMENEIKATAPGVVRRICVVPGDRVEKGEVLVELDSLADGSDQ